MLFFLQSTRYRGFHGLFVLRDVLGYRLGRIGHLIIYQGFVWNGIFCVICLWLTWAIWSHSFRTSAGRQKYSYNNCFSIRSSIDCHRWADIESYPKVMCMQMCILYSFYTYISCTLFERGIATEIHWNQFCSIGNASTNGGCSVHISSQEGMRCICHIVNRYQKVNPKISKQPSPGLKK